MDLYDFCIVKDNKNLMDHSSVSVKKSQEENH